MKKILLFLLSLVASGTALSQVKVTPNGLALDSNEKYLVYDFPGKTAEEIYDLADRYIMSSFVNPDKAKKEKGGNMSTKINPNAEWSKTIGEMINLHISEKDVNLLGRGLFGDRYYWSIDISIIMRFKYGRLRIDVPTVNEMTIDNIDLTAPIRLLSFKGGGILSNNPGLFDKKGKPRNERAIADLEKWINDKIAEIVSGIKSEADDW